jgi:hypothetical protein
VSEPARLGPTRSVAVDGRLRVGGSTRGALARGEPLETEALHGDLVAAGQRMGIPTPVNEALVALAQAAAAQRWAPGQLAPDELRARCATQPGTARDAAATSPE